MYLLYSVNVYIIQYCDRNKVISYSILLRIIACPMYFLNISSICPFLFLYSYFILRPSSDGVFSWPCSIVNDCTTVENGNSVAIFIIRLLLTK